MKAVALRRIAFVALAAVCASALMASLMAATPSDASVASRALGAAAIVHEVSEKQAPPRPLCSFDHSAGANKCPGLLPDNFMTTLSPTALEKANDSLKAKVKNTQRRDIRCSGGNPWDCQDRQKAIPYVNVAARAIDLDIIPEGRYILLGSMEMTPKYFPDWYYNAGGDLGNGPSKKRQIYFIGYRRRATSGELIPSWTIVSYENLEVNLLRKGPSGSITKCGPTDVHDGAEVYSAGFHTCAGKTVLHHFAKEQNVSFSVADDYYACAVFGSRVLNGLPDNACARLRRPRASSLIGSISADATANLLKRMRDARDVPGSDPYWYSCPSGCCTADVDMQ